MRSETGYYWMLRMKIFLFPPSKKFNQKEAKGLALQRGPAHAFCAELIAVKAK